MLPWLKLSFTPTDEDALSKQILHGQDWYIWHIKSNPVPEHCTHKVLNIFSMSLPYIFTRACWVASPLERERKTD